MQRATIVAEMADGSCLVEHVEGFDAFIAVALPFWRDSECLRLTWHETPAPAAEGPLYEHSGQCPWNRSNDLDEELWAAQAREAGCRPARTLPADVA